MSRTLVISDLHIGSRAAIAVLERPAPLHRLLAALEDIDRLVLLGDIIELTEARPQMALTAATPILRAIGSKLGPERTVLLVPGNHDRPLVRRWIRSRGADLEADALVPADASPFLQRIVTLLRPARVEIRYPGVWLAPSVWATHGHYLDRHLVPGSTWGVIRGGRRRMPSSHAIPYDYERSGRVHLTPVRRRLPKVAAAALEELAELARAATMPRLGRRVLHPRIAPVVARLLSFQVRRHGLPALARVVRHLGLEPRWVVFGHVHRLGPLSGDELDRWRVGPKTLGEISFVNTGSWLYEPLLVHRAAPPHPYWPGGAVVLDDDGEPRAVGLLDALADAELTRHG